MRVFRVLVAVVVAVVFGVWAAGAWAQPAGSGRWSFQPVSLPSGSDGPEPVTGYLSAVSCASASACSALGQGANYDIPPPNTALVAEQWDGSSWSAFQPFGGDADASVITGASCVSATRCFAVGENFYQSGPRTAMVAGFDGASWQVADAHNPGNSVLNGVSCTSAQFCLAVGGVQRSVLVDRWNGNRWARLTIRTPHPAQLYSVSCIGSTWCMAVGPAATKSRLGLALSWNGQRWTALRTPTVRGSSDANLSGVSCVSSRFCLAVGQRRTKPSGRTTMLAESWNGSRWSATSIPALPVSRGTSLVSVSCATAVACAAVGPNVIKNRVLIEWWNGTGWAFSPSPALTDRSTSLADVSCVNDPSTTGTNASVWCEAVGHTSDTGDLIAMSYH